MARRRSPGRRWSIRASAIRSVAFAPDGTLLATLGGDGSLVLRDPSVSRGYPLRPAGSDPVRCLAFSPDGKVLATGSRTAAVALYDLDTVGSRALDDAAAATAGAAGLAFAPDGATLAVGQQDGRITLWDVVTGRVRSVLEGMPTSWPHWRSRPTAPRWPPPAATAPYGSGTWRPAASGSRSTARRARSSPCPSPLTASFWPWRTRSARWSGSGMSPPGLERDALRGPAGAVVALAISPDGTTLAAAGRQGLVNCWDLATLKIRPMRLRHAGAYSLAFSPDGHTLASAGVDGTVHLWDWPASGSVRD